jgi:hypothetical protein
MNYWWAALMVLGMYWQLGHAHLRLTTLQQSIGVSVMFSYGNWIPKSVLAILSELHWASWHQAPSEEQNKDRMARITRKTHGTNLEIISSHKHPESRCSVLLSLSRVYRDRVVPQDRKDEHQLLCWVCKQTPIKSVKLLYWYSMIV